MLDEPFLAGQTLMIFSKGAPAGHGTALTYIVLV